MIPFVCTLSGTANSPDIEIGVADEDGYITWIGYVYLPPAFDSDQEVLFHGYTTDVEPFSTTLAHPREQHVKEDCGGRIPSVQDWFRNIKMEPWMNRGYKVGPQEEQAS